VHRGVPRGNDGATASHRRAAFAGFTESHRRVSQGRSPCRLCHSAAERKGDRSARERRCAGCHRKEYDVAAIGPHGGFSNTARFCVDCHPAHPEGAGRRQRGALPALRPVVMHACPRSCAPSRTIGARKERVAGSASRCSSSCSPSPGGRPAGLSLRRRAGEGTGHELDPPAGDGPQISPFINSSSIGSPGRFGSSLPDPPGDGCRSGRVPTPPCGGGIAGLFLLGYHAVVLAAIGSGSTCPRKTWRSFRGGGVVRTPPEEGEPLGRRKVLTRRERGLPGDPRLVGPLRRLGDPPAVAVVLRRPGRNGIRLDPHGSCGVRDRSHGPSSRRPPASAVVECTRDLPPGDPPGDRPTPRSGEPGRVGARSRGAGVLIPIAGGDGERRGPGNRGGAGTPGAGGTGTRAKGSTARRASPSRKALQLLPDYSQARFNLAVALLRDDRREEAKQQLTIFLEKDPFNPMVERAREMLDGIERGSA